MGVHGLTTYLREKKRLLSQTTVLSSSTAESVPIVVDGWSFIYDLYNSYHLPWVYGGEYLEFTRLVKSVVESWVKVGLQVYFVFDGACPELKFPTVISRLVQSHIQPGQLFFRTSTTSRCTGRFLNETRILPPLAYSTCIQALESFRSENSGVDIHFADEEGDPYAVELAGRLGGYVVGNDSDFVIFNSDGYRGYIPLDEMVWQTLLSDESVSINAVDNEFQTVRKPKAKKKPVHNLQPGLLPPEGVDEFTLSFISYRPESLAEHLNVPVTLLPLLGALVGNDFSKESESNSRKIQALFFERQLTLSQRIEKVAKTMHQVIAPGSQKRKAKHQVGSVMDLIDQTVNALLARLASTMGSGEVDAIVDKIVNATLQYAIPKYGGDTAGREGLWKTSVCALHDPEACSILPMISRNVMRQAEESDQADPYLLQARERYLDAYRNGQFSPKNMDILNTGSSWARLFLENPDLETVGRSIGKPIREWIHSILDDSLGLGVAEDARTMTTNSVDPSIRDDEDDDELIDVVESDSDDEGSPADYLAPLKGELQRLHNSDDDATSPPPSVVSHRQLPVGPPSVVEYLRRGTRIASETELVKPILELLGTISLAKYGEVTAPPLSLRPESDRFTVLLRALRSDIPEVRSLSPSYIMPVLAVRWVVLSLQLRWEGACSKEREKEKWTKNEARCFLSSFTWAPNVNHGANDTPESNPPVIEDRNVQLTAQVLMALDSIEQLSQTLLLTERVISVFNRLSGKAFHCYLTGTAPADRLPAGIWEAVEVGTDASFQEERVKKGKKTKAVRTAPIKSTGNRGLFAMLAQADSDA